MPTLHWVGKDKVVNHHHDVPFRVLHKASTFSAPDGLPANSTDNRIIHGDNLEALKSLLPEFEGRVKCIYIDPPYNTGNEGWVYNDAVNDPKIKRWLGQVVGKEGEDLSRHDKWLCMMYPRLKLLHRLLADDGAIFISIDDNEVHTLRGLMDEIWGRANFVASVIWQKKYAVANDHKTIAPMHDYVLVYDKGNWQRNLLPRGEEKDEQYKFTDAKGQFRSDNYTCNKSADERPNLYYPVTNPNTGEEIWPKRTRVWSYSQEEHRRHIEEDLIYWGKNGQGKVPAFKRYKHTLKNADGVVPQTLWMHDFAGHTDSARKELRELLNDVSAVTDFATPKPTQLISRILQLSTSPDSIVLDSFAGSGTTGHAVLKLNAQDGGKRRFIMIEMEYYADAITAERIRRVMSGYGEGQKAALGLGGGFDYYTIGEPLFLPDDNLNETVGAEAIRGYVAYSEGIPAADRTTADNPHSPYLLGLNRETAWLFHYEPDRATSLDMDFLGTLRFGGDTGAARPGTFIIYADRCLLSKDFMTRHGIIFKKIPRDITRF
jgi:adenine-specific DNA-methyltransferase